MRITHILGILLIPVLLVLSACSSSVPVQPSPATTGLTQPPTGLPSAISTSVPASSVVSPTAALSPPKTLSVHFIDVGQGDATLIDFGETEILIDGGEKVPGVVDYIRPFVDGPLDVLIATHSDGDHIGGLADVLANYKINDVWINGLAASTQVYSTFMNALNTEGAAVHTAELGSLIQAGTLKLECYNPVKPLLSDGNNDSIVCSLRFGSVVFLFTADASSKAEGRMLVQSMIPLPDCDILKVGFHGNRGASTPAFLSVVKPEVAVYSCAKVNTWGSPGQETLTNLDKIGAAVYGTDVHGTVLVTTDGIKYAVQPARQLPPVKPSRANPN